MVLKYKTDTLTLFYGENKLNRVEHKFFAESYGGDSESSYRREGYHINDENFFDGTVSITDTLTKNVISDYPIKYEERYEFYRKNYTFSYMSFDGKKISDYFKSKENPSKGYFFNLLSVDLLLSKADFPVEKPPKSLYNTKNNNDEIYADQDSLKVYELESTNNYKIISSSISFKYLREINVQKQGTSTKYFAKIFLKNEGVKYIDLKEIENILVFDPHENRERFVTAPQGLEMYDNTYSDDFFENKEYFITKLPYGAMVEKESDYSTEYIYKNGRKGNLTYVIFNDDEGESYKGIVFSGYLSINKPE
ncbi:hypothetical protein ACQ9BO_07130 [Flavobacterium sp. P21]|uniref:hypothetical protein n=1 Tax=Flavobacterium sp. P21 TaxID=3423948 RepID=UPI003D66D165